MKIDTDNPVFVALGGLIALTVAMGIGRFVYTSILPYMVEGLGLSKSQAGLIASANFLGYLLGALAASSSRLPGSRRAWFFGALAVSAFSTAAMAMPDNMAAFLILRFLGGVASAFVLVFSSVLILDRLAVAGRPKLSAVHFAGVGCGIALSAVIVSGFGTNGSDWRQLWLVSGIVSIIGMAIAFMLVPKEDRFVDDVSGRADNGLTRQLVQFIVAYGLFGFGYVITATFISDMVRGSAALRPVESYIWLAVGLGAIPSVAFWTGIGRKWTNNLSFALACLVEAFAVALSVLSENPTLVVLSAILLGATFMGITALGLINARVLATGDPRRALALMTAAFGLGQMIGPSFAGFVHDISGSFLLPSLVAAAALVIAAGLTLRLRH